MSEDAGPFDVPHEPCSEFVAICDGQPHAVTEGIKPMSKPADQWWTINGQAIMDVMNRAHAGENPELLYLELIANSETGADDE